MKTLKLLIISLLLLSVSLVCCGCGASSTTVKCTNGYFHGYPEYNTGVLSFKGIPYAQSPIGELRWKVPQVPAKSKAIALADKFGFSSIQNKFFTYDITTDISEDCLTLNVWTKDLDSKYRPVMVYFHGGDFSHGGTSENIYNGQYIVNKHNDVIIVTVNYRLGMMGFVDLSTVSGGDNYPESKELGLYDCLEALNWLKNNISGFGGDPNNVTIFGDAAGGTIVSCLLSSDYAGDLFQRAICMSGSMKNTYTDEDFTTSRYTSNLLKLSGANNMDDLMALSFDNLVQLNSAALTSEGFTLNDLHNYPLRGGSIVKLDYYEAVENASRKGVDLLIGTCKNDLNFYITQLNNRPMAEMEVEDILASFYAFEEYYIVNPFQEIISSATTEQREKINMYADMIGGSENVWAKAQFLTEAIYHQPAIRMAEHHSAGNVGRTYMYLYEKENDYLPFLGACQMSELPYVFHNLNVPSSYGTLDSDLADYMCEAWVNFAKNGNPSTENVTWEEYETFNRKTMIIGNDSSIYMKSDPDKEIRELLSWTADN